MDFTDNSMRYVKAMMMESRVQSCCIEGSNCSKYDYWMSISAKHHLDHDEFMLASCSHLSRIFVKIEC